VLKCQTHPQLLRPTIDVVHFILITGSPLLGKENVAGPTMSGLSSHFGLSPLIDKWKFLGRADRREQPDAPTGYGRWKPGFTKSAAVVQTGGLNRCHGLGSGCDLKPD
jgi:hypothetical protein